MKQKHLPYIYLMKIKNTDISILCGEDITIKETITDLDQTIYELSAIREQILECEKGYIYMKEAFKDYDNETTSGLRVIK